MRGLVNGARVGWVDWFVRLRSDLGMRVVAEGVETTAQLDRLREIGCDVVQGYLLARPMPPAEVPALILLMSAAPAR